MHARLLLSLYFHERMLVVRIHMPVCDVELECRMHETLQPATRTMHSALRGIPSTFNCQVLRAIVSTRAMQQYRHRYEYWLLTIGVRRTRETIPCNLLP